MKKIIFFERMIQIKKIKRSHCWKTVLFLLIAFFLVGCESKKPENYNEYIDGFEDISADQLSEHEKLLLYVGFEDCAYCQSFVPKLYAASQEQNVKVYVIDLDNSSDEDYKFLEENEILYVPDLSVVSNGDITERMIINDDSTIDDISDFIKSNYK